MAEDMAAAASDVLNATPAVREIAGYAGSVLRTGLTARSFLAAFKHPTAQLGTEKCCSVVQQLNCLKLLVVKLGD